MAKNKATFPEKKTRPAAKKDVVSNRLVKKTTAKSGGSNTFENISFQQFLEFAPVAFIAMDKNNIIQFANAHAEEVFGYSRKQLIGQDFEFLIPERFRNSHQKKHKKYLTNPQKRVMGSGLDIFCRHSDGTEVPVEIGLNPVEIDGKVYVLASITDISVQKAFERSDKDNSRRYHNLFENSLDAILVVDDEQRYVDVNPAACSMLGYTKEEFLTKRIQDIVATSEDIKEQLWEDFIANKKQQNTIFLKRKDGKIILTEYTAVSNFMTGLHVSLCRDITARHMAETKLRESEKKLNAILQTLMDGVVMVNTEGEIIFANKASEKILGIQQDKITGKYFNSREWQQLDEFDNPFPLEQLPLAVAMREQRPVENVEHAILATDGEKKWLTVNAAPLFDEDGNMYGAIAGFQDTTERKIADAKLRENHERFEMALAAGNQGSWMVDWVKKTNIVDERWAAMLGYTLDEVGRGLDFWESHIHPDDLKPLYEEFEKHVRGEIPMLEVELRARTKTGEWRWIADRARIVKRTPNGEPLLMYGTHTDVTEKKQAEEKLRLNLHAMESAVEGIIITDPLQPNNPIIYANQGFANITGYTSDEVIGKNCRFLQGPGTDPDTLKELRKCIEERSAFEGEILNYKKDGTPFWNYLRISHIVNAKGQVTHMVGFQSDITARKEAETQYRTLVEQNPAIVYIAGLNQHIGVTYISPQINSLGFTQEEWVADPDMWLRQIHPDDKQRITEEIEHYSKNNVPFHSEYRLVARNGEVRWFLDEAVDAFDNRGTPLFRQGFMLDITARKLAEEALSERERYLSLLNKATTTIITTQDLDALPHMLVEDLKELLGADDCYMTRWDESEDRVIPLSSTAKMEQPYQQIPFPSNLTSMTSSVIKEGRVLVAEDTFNSPYISPELAQRFPARSMLGIPMLYGNTKLGAILVAYNTQHTFDQNEVDRAKQAGRQIAIALWSVQQDFELKKRVREQAALARITTLLSQTEHIGLSNLLNLIVDSARELIPGAQQGVIHLIDKAQNLLIPEAVSGYESFDGIRGKLQIGEGIAGLAIKEGKSIYIPSIDKDERFITLNPKAKYLSLLVSPIISGPQKLGAISIQSEKPYAFSTNEINLLSELGQQAAIAIENARLYAAVQQELNERRQAETALRNSEERYRSISEDMPAMICRFLPDGTITFANTAYGQFYGKTPQEIEGTNLLLLIVEEEREKIKNTYLSLSPEKPSVTYEIQEVNFKGEKRWIQWTDRRIFNEGADNIEYQTIGIDVTDRKLSEIEREHLLHAEHEQRLLAETSADATLALVSHTETEEVLYEILNQVQKLIPGCGANIALLEGDVLRTAAWRGYKNRGESIFKDLVKQTHTYPMEQKLLRDPRPVLIRDTHNDPDWKIIPGLEWIRSHLCIPLLWNKELLGLLYIDEDTPNKFTEETANRLTPLVNATTVALESAILIESTRKALSEISALYHINKGLVALDTDELLREAVELLRNNFNYYHVQVFVINQETGNFLLKAASGEIGNQMVENRHEVRAGAGIIGYAAETGLPFFTNNVRDVVFFMPNPNLPETNAEMAVPIRNENQLYGILDIQQTAARPFTQRDQQLVITVADQIAVALHKAELYKNLQTALQQEKTIRNQLIQNERLAVMGRLLASVSHELNNPLQAIQNALFLLKEEKGMSQQGMNDLEIVIAESERMAGMIERLRDTYRPPQAEDLQPTYINSIIEDVYALLATHLRKNEVAFEFHPDPDAPAIMALPDQIRQVALNLLINAVEAMPNGGRVIVHTIYLRETREVMLSVSDSGTGIAPSVLPYIFDPFITNKKRGTGIGLTISHDIVIKHRGRITAENNLGEPGATFKVWLSVEQTPAEIE